MHSLASNSSVFDKFGLFCQKTKKGCRKKKVISQSIGIRKSVVLVSVPTRVLSESSIDTQLYLPLLSKIGHVYVHGIHELVIVLNETQVWIWLFHCVSVVG